MTRHGKRNCICRIAFFWLIYWGRLRLLAPAELGHNRKSDAKLIGSLIKVKILSSI